MRSKMRTGPDKPRQAWQSLPQWQTEIHRSLSHQWTQWQVNLESSGIQQECEGAS